MPERDLRRDVRSLQRQGHYKDSRNRVARLRYVVCLALRLNAGVVLCRKPGKLPCDTVQESYAKEYGKDTIEIHKDAINENDVILLHDDLLATGGTMQAACNLVKKFHPKKVYCNFIIELVNEGLNGRADFDKDIEITSLIQI